jgi:hypothetical protein
MGLQGAANAKGHIPNFFEGTDAAASGMGISMLAFAFMGMGDAAGDMKEASKKTLQNAHTEAIRDEQKSRKALASIRQQGADFKTNVVDKAQAAYDKQAAAVKKLPSSTPSAHMSSMNKTLLGLQQNLAAQNATLAAIGNVEKTATARLSNYTTAAAAAGTAVADHGKVINPATGKPYTSKAAGRMHKFGAGMQRMGLPMAFAGPMIGGMVAAGMPGNTRSERRDRALASGAGNAIGYAGIGAMVGTMAYQGTVMGAGTGGPAGAAIGAAIGLITGGAMAITAGTNAYLKVLPELASQSELASAALKDFQNGTSGFVRALGDYSEALRNTTGRLTPQDLKERRDVMMQAMGNIPGGARGKIISTMNDPDRMNAVMSKEQLKLSADAESKALTASLGKMQDEQRTGAGMNFWEGGNWNPFSSKFWATGDDTGFAADLGIGTSYQHLSAQEAGLAATGRKDDSWWDVASLENPLARTKKGIEKLDSWTVKYARTLDLSNMSTAQLTAQMKEMDDVFDGATGMAGYTQTQIMAIFNKLGGDTRAIRNSTLADAQYIGSAMVERLQAMIVDAEMTELLTQSINNQKDAADRARESMERLEDVLQTVYIRGSSAVSSLTKNASTAEDVRGMRSTGQRGIALSEMGLASDLIKPFLGPQESQRLENATQIAGILSQNTSALEKIDSSIRKDLLKGLGGEFGKSSTNMTKAFQSAVRGDRSKLESYLTKAGRTKGQANALATLTELVGDRMKDGMGTNDLMKFVENQINTNNNLKEIRNDNTVMQNVLESIRQASENGNASLLKTNEQLANQLQLNELQNTYAQELIRIQKTLSYQGGIQSYTKGTHSGLLAVDSLMSDVQMAPRSISPTISEGIASFKSADMFKNFFGAENIPKELMGQAVAGRAQQMAQTAREYELQTGVELPGWMKDMGSEGTIEAATNQVQASLKDAVPAKLEEVRSQILRLQETLVSENVNVVQSMGAQFLSATETVFGNGAQNITGGGRGTITSLIEQQAKIFTMQVDQRKALELQVDTEAQSTKQDSARLDLLNKSNNMIRSFRNMMMGNKWENQKTSGMSQQAFVTDMIGANIVSPQDVNANMDQVKEMFEARMEAMAAVLKNVGSGADHKKVDYRGMEFAEALQKEVDRYRNIFSQGVGTNQGPNEDFEDMKITSKEQGFYMGRILEGAESLGELGNEMFAQGGYQGLIEEYNQATHDLAKVNQDRMTAEQTLINNINSFASQYGHAMQSGTVGLGPNQAGHGNVGGAHIPQVPSRHRGGILESIGLKARGTDVVPAMLTPGEFIVNAKDTRKNKALLEAMNSGKVSYAANGGLMNRYASQYPDSYPYNDMHRPRGLGHATAGNPQALNWRANTLDPAQFSNPQTTQARRRQGIGGQGGQGYGGWSDQQAKSLLKTWKEAVDKMVKAMPDTHRLEAYDRIQELSKDMSRDPVSKKIKSFQKSRDLHTPGSTTYEHYDTQIQVLRNISKTAKEQQLSMREMGLLWNGYLEEAKKAEVKGGEANRLVQEMPEWFKDLQTTFTKIPESLEEMKKTAREWKKRLKEVNDEIAEIDLKLTGITDPTARAPLQSKRAQLISERMFVQRGQGQLSGAISREEAKPGEVTDYTKRVQEAQKRRKEGMRNLLGDIYGRYERPSQDEAKDALQDKWGTEGFGKPTRREIENYRLENSQWKGMTTLGDSFINPRSQFGMIDDYQSQINSQMNNKLADQFEASGLSLSKFMNKKGLETSTEQQTHMGYRYLEREDLKRQGKLTPDKKKALLEKERQEAIQMMRGDIFFREKRNKKGEITGEGLEKVIADAAHQKAGTWGFGMQKTMDTAIDTYEMKEKIKDRPETEAKKKVLEGTIADLTKELKPIDKRLDVLNKELKPIDKGGRVDHSIYQPWLQGMVDEKDDLEEKKKTLMHKRESANLDRQGLKYSLEYNTPENLQKLNQKYDQEWNARMDASGVDKDKMLTDEYGNRLAPHKMAEYLDQPKFKGTLDMGKLSQEYDRYSGSLDRSFDVMQNLKTATEFRTKVQQRFTKVAKEAAKAGLTVNQTMSAMANEMKKVALDMKLERGEISGRSARAGNVQYYQGKVDDGTYNFGDMGGQFSSHFIRNARDDMQDMKDLIDSTATTMRDGFKTAFKEFASGTKTSKEAFTDFAMSIASNIFSRALDFGSENFMSYLMGQRRASGGLVRGYSNGGRVTGGTGPRSDDVPMFGSGGEFVIRADSAKKIGYDTLEKLNSLKGYSRGGGISAVLRNQIDFDDPEQPKTMVKNIDPMLSMIGQEDQINPQNRKKFEREEAFYSHRKNEHDREKANAEKMAAFKQQKKQMLKSGWMSAAMSLTSAAAAHYGDTNAIGKFLNSTGGKMMTSAGIGGAFGGKKGAIMGGISGLGAGLMGKWQKEHEAQQAIKFEKDLSTMMAKPSFQRQLALQKERQGLSTVNEHGLMRPFSTDSQSDIFRDRNRLSKIESELHQLNPAFPNPNPPPSKGFWAGLKGGANKIGQGIKKTPGAIWGGIKAPFGGDFWGNPGMDLFKNPLRRQALGGLVRRATGGIVSDSTGQFMQMNKSFGTDDVLNTTGMSPQGGLEGSGTMMGGLGMVKDSGMYSNGGGTRNFGLDNILARVSKGEFIFDSDSTRYLGADALDRLNKGDIQGFMDLSNLSSIKGYAQGGYVGSGLPTLSAGGDSTGGTNTFDTVNQNLVKLIDSVDGVRETIETQGGEDSPSKSTSRGSSREVANNISITVNVDKSGKVSSRNENDSQNSKGGEGGGDEKDSDRKDKEKNKKLGEMMEVQILQVITEQKRPGGLLDDKG